MKKNKIIIIDNYDSFTYNLSHLLKELGADVKVLRNDQFELSALNEFDGIVLSPGPGIPSEAGLLLDVIRTYAGKKPILGVCLGHQAIGEVFGGKLENLSEESSRTSRMFSMVWQQRVVWSWKTESASIRSLRISVSGSRWEDTIHG